MSTLLDGGYARCAECGGKMTRYWDRRGKCPYYKCARRSGTPLHPCRAHQIRAGAVDDLALRLLADVLTDPERILELADAAEQQYATATTDAALAEATLAASLILREEDRHIQAAAGGVVVHSVLTRQTSSRAIIAHESGLRPAERSADQGLRWGGCLGGDLRLCGARWLE